MYRSIGTLWSTIIIVFIHETEEPNCPSLIIENGDYVPIDDGVGVHCFTGFKLIGDGFLICLPHGEWDLPIPTCVKDCGRLFIDNGQFNASSGTTLGNSATQSCNSGYILSGEHIVTCTETGWSAAAAICTIVDCGDPTPEFATLNGANFNYGSVLDVTCNNGYNIIGSPTITCQTDGTWSDIPTCRPYDCGRRKITYGYFNAPSGTTLGNTATQSCYTGYTFTGEHLVTCTETGWSAAAAICTIVDCGDPTPEFAILSGRSFIYGVFLEVVCNDGYNINGSSFITCQANGTWSDIPTCRPYDCGDLSIANGQFYAPLGTTFGNTATQSCNTGYTLSGKTTVSCTESGWSDAAAICSIVDCGDPTPAFATLSGTNFKYESELDVTCNNGYNIIRSPTITCLADGTWSEIPTCRPYDCGTRIIANGQFNAPSGTTFGNSATQSCNTGYTFSGETAVSCTESGWSAVAAICTIVDCGDPTPAFATLSGTNFKYESELDVTCNNGYNIIGSPTITCLADGTWSEIPTCRPYDCGELDIANGQFDAPSGTTFGNSATQSCNTGYSFTGEKTISCSETGWSATAATCTIVDCGDPTPEFAKLNDADFVIGSVLEVICNKGYHIIGSPTITCQADGTWSDIPTCQATHDCGAISIVNGQFNAPSGTTLGHSATQLCNTGYTLSGAATVTCTETGWSAIAAICTIVDCFTPIITNSDVAETPVGTTYNATVKLSCLDGYTLNGNAFVTCQASGNWDNLPTCDIKNCGDPTPDFATLNDTNLYYGSVLEVTCNNGYNIIGSPTITCQADGTWSDIPACRPYDCGQPENPQGNGNVVASRTLVGDIAHYTCSFGYRMNDGNETRHCQSNGTWNGTVPSCVPYDSELVTCQTETDERGTLWQEHVAGETLVLICPQGFDVGNISRECGIKGQWKTPRYNCLRDSVKEVERTVAALRDNPTGDELLIVAKELSTVTNSSISSDSISSLTDAEIDVLGDVMVTVSSQIQDNSAELDDITDNILETASNLIDQRNRVAWKTLQVLDNKGPDIIMGAVETLAHKKTRNFEENLTVKPNIALAITKTKSDMAKFPIINNNNVSNGWLKTTKTKIQVQASEFLGQDFVYFGILYNNMTELLAGIDKTNMTNTEKIVNGPVVSLTLVSPPANFTPTVTYLVEHSVDRYSQPSCNFWAVKSNSRGHWSTDGCSVVSSNDSITQCKCDHLTNFAVLMSPFVPVESQSSTLHIITIVGTSISMFCLLVTLLVHLCLYRYLRSERVNLLLNLCVALILAYIVFLTGVDRTESKVICTCVAAVLHYIFLVVFFIMLAEGIDILISVVFIFNKKKQINTLLVAAWLTPAIIVGVSLGVTKTDGYGNDNFCWLSIDNGLVWAFVGPAAGVIAVNIIILSVTICKMLHLQSVKEKAKSEQIKTIIWSLCVLLPLMGISWIIGIFYINETLVWMQYLFAVCNGLQGFFIFVMHCLLNTQLRRACTRAEGKRKRSAEMKTNKITMRNTSSAQKYVDSSSQQCQTSGMS